MRSVTLPMRSTPRVSVSSVIPSQPLQAGPGKSVRLFGGRTKYMIVDLFIKITLHAVLIVIYLYCKCLARCTLQKHMHTTRLKPKRSCFKVHVFYLMLNAVHLPVPGCPGSVTNPTTSNPTNPPTNRPTTPSDPNGQGNQGQDKVCSTPATIVEQDKTLATILGAFAALFFLTTMVLGCKACRSNG